MEKKKTFIDIGANFDGIPCFYQNNFQEARSSFEPINNTFRYFEINIKKNKCKNIITNNSLLDEIKKFFFYSESHSGMTSSRNLKTYLT